VSIKQVEQTRRSGSSAYYATIDAVLGTSYVAMSHEGQKRLSQVRTSIRMTIRLTPRHFTIRTHALLEHHSCSSSTDLLASVILVTFWNSSECLLTYVPQLTKSYGIAYRNVDRKCEHTYPLDSRPAFEAFFVILPGPAFGPCSHWCAGMSDIDEVSSSTANGVRVQYRFAEETSA
jgi:hypothetical protein